MLIWEYFECHRCGQCCEQIGLPYDPYMCQTIADFLDISVSELIVHYYGKLSSDGGNWISEDDKRTPCPFLKTEGTKRICEIYSVRPEGCKLYPFDTDFGRDGVDCPGARKAYDKLRKTSS